MNVFGMVLNCQENFYGDMLEPFKQNKMYNFELKCKVEGAAALSVYH